MAMQFGNNTIFGVALQHGSGTTQHDKLVAGFEEKNGTDSEFNYYPVTDLGFAPVKVTDALPPECGGLAFTSGLFTTGIWGEGPASLIARLSNRLGWLLYAALGDCETVANTAIENTTELGGTEGSDTGITTHIFRPYVDDKLFVPYFTLRRLLPHTVDNERPGEVYQDARLRSLTLAGGAGGPVGCDIDAIGRTSQDNYVFEHDPGWSATFDDLEDFAVTNCAGFFKINDVPFKTTAASFTMINNLLGAQQALAIGSAHPMDFPVLSRAGTIAATIMLEDYDLYVSTFKGTDLDFSTSSGENVGCEVYVAPVDLHFAAQTKIGATTEPYELKIVGNQTLDNIAWTFAPLRIRPNTPVVLQATGTFKAVGGSEYPVMVFLQNDVSAGYTVGA